MNVFTMNVNFHVRILILLAAVAFYKRKPILNVIFDQIFEKLNILKSLFYHLEKIFNSSDLAKLDFILWGYVKSIVCRRQPTTDDIKELIRDYFQTINRPILKMQIHNKGWITVFILNDSDLFCFPYLFILYLYNIN